MRWRARRDWPAKAALSISTVKCDSPVPVVAHVARVAGAVVDDREMGGGEGIGQKPFDFLCDWSRHGFPS